MPKNQRTNFLLTFSFITLLEFSLLLSGCIKKKTDEQLTK